MFTIPEEIKITINKLKKAGFEAYIVGGCVRDLLQEEEPDDWDITTNAKPEEIKKIFPKSFYENKFFTVTVQVETENPKLKEIQITTFRSETKYTDKRHPDEVKFVKNLEEDLKRRDFTVNAIAIEIQDKNHKIIDLFDGQKDLKNKIIRTVGDANERFNEDALRMMRAVRFTATLNKDSQKEWTIEKNTIDAIKKNCFLLKVISQERIRDEFLKIIMSQKPEKAIESLRQFGLLKYIVPELEEGYGIKQNKHHIYECYEHSLLSLKYAAQREFNKYVRIAALFHDIAKPRVKAGEGLNATFYNHEIIGAKMTKQILSRLKFPEKDIEKIVKLVRYHLFYYNVDEVSEKSVRRLVHQVGIENMEELLQLRMADRIGSGVPKAEPYKLRHLKYVIEKVSRDPISVKMLKINGNDIMRILQISPGPKVGQILNILLEYVLEDPMKNKKEFLEKQVKKLNKLTEKELILLNQRAKNEKEKIEIKKDAMTKQKYWVT